MKRGIDPMPAFVAAILTATNLAKFSKESGMNKVISDITDKFKEPIGYADATKEVPLTVPGMFVDTSTATLPGFYPSFQQQDAM